MKAQMKVLRAAFFALLAAAGTAAAQETTLNAVVFVPRNTTFGEIFVRFVEQANKDGKGLVQIKLIGGPDAIPTFEQGNAIRNGVVDGYGWPAIGMFDLGWGPHTKYRIDPGFYNVLVNVVVNLNKWNSLREDQKAFLNRMATWLETENVRWVAERKAADEKKIKDAGIQIVDFGPGHRKAAYDAYWEHLAKRAPEPTSELKALSDKLR